MSEFDRTEPAFAAYVAPARRYPQVWRILAGFGVVAVLSLSGPLFVLAALAAFAGVDAAAVLAREIQSGETPRAMLFLLSTFLSMAAGPALAARFLHRRPVKSLFGRGPVVLHDFAVSAAVALAVGLVPVAGLLAFLDMQFQLAAANWLLLLPLGLIGVAVQTMAEELVFRAYAMQQLAARFRSPIVWFALPAVVFGVAHLDPTTYGANSPLFVATAMLFGLAAADLVRLTGSIGAAWGFHFASNTIAILLVAPDQRLSGLALFIAPISPTDTTIVPLLVAVDAGSIIVTWAILRRLLRR